MAPIATCRKTFELRKTTRDSIEKSGADQSAFQSYCHSELDFEGDDDSARASGSMRREGIGLGSLLVGASDTVARGAGGIAPLASVSFLKQRIGGHKHIWCPNVSETRKAP